MGNWLTSEKRMTKEEMIEWTQSIGYTKEHTQHMAELYDKGFSVPRSQIRVNREKFMKTAKELGYNEEWIEQAIRTTERIGSPYDWVPLVLHYED